MEIPKNTTQIGEVHGNYKVFVEDYVISYMKQLCRQEPDRKKRIALYGMIRKEEPQEYFFIYGGAEVPRHGKNDFYLTKPDYEEITWIGEKHFSEYTSLGFVTIEDELPEGMYLFCDGKEIYVQGFHIFYEKNESMLTFMIHRQNESTSHSDLEHVESTESVNYENKMKDSVRVEKEQDAIATRQGEARQILMNRKQEEIPGGEVKLFGIVKSAAAAVFIVLCVTAISTMNGLGKIEGLQNYFQKAFHAMTEKKIPDREETVPTSAQTVGEEEAIMRMQAENLSVEKETFVEEENTVTQNEIPVQETVEMEATVVVQEQQEPLMHTIQTGETLISISNTYYGNDGKVQEICELNGITNSDNIQVGQKIILP